jgi:hypothetical protein
MLKVESMALYFFIVRVRISSLRNSLSRGKTLIGINFLRLTRSSMFCLLQLRISASEWRKCLKGVN